MVARIDRPIQALNHKGFPDVVAAARRLVVFEDFLGMVFGGSMGAGMRDAARDAET